MFVSQTASLTPTQKLQRAHVALMSNDHTMPYAGVLMVGKYLVCDDTPTAKTNGIDCWYGRGFIDSLSDSDLRGLILHENLHKTFQHMFLWKHLYEEDPRTANMACDCVINLIIKDVCNASGGFVTLPKAGLLDERFRGMSSQDVYDILRKEGGGSGSALDEHDWESGEQEADVEAVTKEINQALRQGQLLAGKLGANQSRDIATLLEPKIDWREQLRQYVSSLASGKDISTWRRVNRRWLQHDMYMPSTISESVGRIVIAIDTSGSIDNETLTAFLSEVQGVCANAMPERVDLMYWDTKVARHEVYAQDKLDKLTTTTKPAGGGGTNVECVPRYIHDNGIKPECVIVLTDGHIGGSWGTWDCPVLWCISGNLKARPTVGTAVHID